MNWRFVNWASVNGAMNDRLPADHLTAFSIGAHSQMLSPERTHLLITKD